MKETPFAQRVIRSKETGLWMNPQGEWTGDFAQIRCFQGVVEAMRAVECAALKNV